MNLEHRDSGLLIATADPPACSAPPSATAQDRIREALAGLAEKLDEFEQTCHGRIRPCTVADVSEAIVACYESPTPFTISDLAQAIRGFVEAAQ